MQLEDIVAELATIPCIKGIDPVLLDLRERSIESILGTVTRSFAAEEFRRRHEFAAVSGTEAELRDGVPTGVVKRHFDEWDKLAFVRSHCEAKGIGLSECIAVGTPAPTYRSFRPPASWSQSTPRPKRVKPPASLSIPKT